MTGQNTSDFHKKVTYAQNTLERRIEKFRI